MLKIHPNIPTLEQYYEAIGKNAKTTRNFCIAEFIDNSIESFERGNKGNVNGLIISVNLKIVRKTIGQIIEQQSLEIIDNAQGISDDKLNSIISLYEGHSSPFVNNDIMKKGNYGVGFKYASFVLGNGFIINSKFNKNKEYCIPVVIDSTNRNKRIAEFEFNGIDDFENKIATSSGTCITIPLIKQDKHFSLDELNYLVEFLSYRYSNSIKKGCKITVFCDLYDFKKIIPCNTINFFNIYKIPSNDDKGFISINDDLRQRIINFISTNQLMNPFTKEIKDEKHKKIFMDESLPWNKIFEQDGLQFEYEYKLNNDHNIRIKWGMLSHEYRRSKRYGNNLIYTFQNLNGLTTMIADRSINHPLRLVEEPDSGPLKIKGDMNHGSMPKLIIIADFSNAGEYAAPEVNKKSIEWNDIKKKKEFDKEIKTIRELAHKYFADTLQPIINFIENGCVNETDIPPIQPPTPVGTQPIEIDKSQSDTSKKEKDVPEHSDIEIKKKEIMKKIEICDDRSILQQIENILSNGNN